MKNPCEHTCSFRTIPPLSHFHRPSWALALSDIATSLTSVLAHTPIPFSPPWLHSVSHFRICRSDYSQPNKINTTQELGMADKTSWRRTRPAAAVFWGLSPVAFCWHQVMTDTKHVRQTSQMTPPMILISWYSDPYVIPYLGRECGLLTYSKQ